MNVKKTFALPNGNGVGGGVGISKIVKILHQSFLCDGQGTDRCAILYKSRSRYKGEQLSDFLLASLDIKAPLEWGANYSF